MKKVYRQALNDKKSTGSTIWLSNPEMITRFQYVMELIIRPSENDGGLWRIYDNHPNSLSTLNDSQVVIIEDHSMRDMPCAVMRQISETSDNFRLSRIFSLIGSNESYWENPSLWKAYSEFSNPIHQSDRARFNGIGASLRTHSR